MVRSSPLGLPAASLSEPDRESCWGAGLSVYVDKPPSPLKAAEGFATLSCPFVADSAGDDGGIRDWEPQKSMGGGIICTNSESAAGGEEVGNEVGGG